MKSRLARSAGVFEKTAARFIKYRSRNFVNHAPDDKVYALDNENYAPDELEGSLNNKNHARNFVGGARNFVNHALNLVGGALNNENYARNLVGGAPNKVSGINNTEPGTIFSTQNGVNLNKHRTFTKFAIKYSE